MFRISRDVRHELLIRPVHAAYYLASTVVSPRAMSTLVRAAAFPLHTQQILNAADEVLTAGRAE